MIRFEDYVMPAADLGVENPLPDLKTKKGLGLSFALTERVDKSESVNFGEGFIKTTIPYKQQDGYTRERKMKKFKAAIIENDYLRAIFLPELGGRLWSIYDKKAEKELLYVNPVFQPCNLGVRNAWFSGGVEFNAGVRGHSPLTCSPMYCAVAKTSKGEVLNIYEFERIRGVSYCISAHLPENSKTLYLNIKVENRTDDDKYMYWWSNIAVAEKPDTRVIVPTKNTFRFFYHEGHYVIDNCTYPETDEVDFSYPQKLDISQDFFFKIPDDEQKWIATTDSEGKGLLHYSTKFLKGRKLFLWGMAQGGRNWNEFLSKENEAYIEIQAGISTTQLEHIKMPANTEWSWTEAYTMLDGDADKLNGNNWADAIKEVEGCIDEKIGDEIDSFPSDVISKEVIYEGSGWGALENKIRDKSISKYFDYTNTSDIETKQWFYLLKNGRLPKVDVKEEPQSYVVGKFWQQKLESIEDKSWYEHLQLGVIYYAAEMYDEALNEWKKSVEKKESCWAYRNIALTLKNDFGNENGAYENIKKAYWLNPESRALCREYAELLTELCRPDELIENYDKFPENLQKDSRIRMYKAKAYIDTNRLEEATKILNNDFVLPDNREGELSVSYLWMQLYTKLYGDKAEEKAPLPKHLDFRMQ